MPATAWSSSPPTAPAPPRTWPAPVPPASPACSTASPSPTGPPSSRPSTPSPRPPVSRSRRGWLLLAVLAVLAACGPAGPTDRQTEVAERGSRVMPLHLDATTHRFEPDADGLTQTVVSD